MKYKLTFALVALMTSTAFAAFQAPLPEFRNEKQLAEWREEKASEATSQSYKAEDTAFYTGKPYLASSGNYAFKYRSYNPELTRWTSEDPSGFPDGANQSIYAPTPTNEFDYAGLLTQTITDGSWAFSMIYTLSYDWNTSPTLQSGPDLGGLTNFGGFPAGWSLTVGAGTLSGITSSVSGRTKTWTGDLSAPVTLKSTFGLSIGSFTAGATFSDTKVLKSTWSVSVVE